LERLSSASLRLGFARSSELTRAIINKNPVQCRRPVIDVVSMSRLSNNNSLSLGKRSFSSQSKGDKGDHSADKNKNVVEKSGKQVAVVSKMETIKKELVTVINEELAELKRVEDPEDVDTSKWLETNKYQIEVKDGVVNLKRNDKAYNVTITFDSFPDEEAAEASAREKDNINQREKDEEEEEEEAEDVIDGKEVDGEAGAADDKSYKHPMRADIAILDKQGKTKGTFSFQGVAGSDGRLYVDMIVCTTDVPKAVPGSEETMFDSNAPQLEFDSLSQDMQDKIYDLLDEVGIDDNMAVFVQDYVEQSTSRIQRDFMENMKKVLM